MTECRRQRAKNGDKLKSQMSAVRCNCKVLSLNSLDAYQGVLFNLPFAINEAFMGIRNYCVARRRPGAHPLRRHDDSAVEADRME